jgi:hypothetical protein
VIDVARDEKIGSPAASRGISGHAHPPRSGFVHHPDRHRDRRDRGIVITGIAAS